MTKIKSSSSVRFFFEPGICLPQNHRRKALCLNFAVTDERIAAFSESTYFVNLSVSKKRKDKASIEKEVAKGKQQQQDILSALQDMKPLFSKGEQIKNRDDFEAHLVKAFKASPIKLDAA